jgi:hypothetical protein
MKGIFVGFLFMMLAIMYLGYRIFGRHAIHTIQLDENYINYEAQIGPLKTGGKILISGITNVELRKLHEFKFYGKYGYLLIRSGIASWSFGTDLNEKELETLLDKINVLVEKAKTNTD